MSDAGKLLAWYDRARRELPWRGARDPFLVLVSEVMLQQTQVATVIPHYLRFVTRYPSAAALAAAPLAEVLSAWSGLGYYRRARHLHRTAQAVAARADGFPRTARELGELPGVGPYTAAAVASIAFGEVVPVLDGNVARVLARRLALAEPVARAAGRRQLLAAAGELLDPARPGDSNQALMELGATLCRPRTPRCRECPLEVGCAAREQGRPEGFPVADGGRPTERQARLGVVVAREGRVLLFRRGEAETMLAGFWELPTVAADGEEEVSLAARYGGRFRLGARLGRFRHGVTFRALEIEVRRAEWDAPCDEVAEGREAAWLTPQELAGEPLSAGLRKALQLWEKAGTTPGPD